MKQIKNYINRSLCLLATAALYACATEQLQDMATDSNATSRALTTSVVWTVKSEAGKLSELIATKSTETGQSIDKVTRLNVDGTINSTDTETLKNLQHLDTLMLTEAIIINEQGVETDTFPEMNYAKSEMMVKLPNSARKIVNEAFVGSNIKEIDLNQINLIPNGLFHYCRQLIKVTMSDEVTEIGMNAFSECNALTTIKLPADLTKIGGWAFFSCSNLITFEGRSPIGLKEVGGKAFANCKSLTEIELPDNVTHLMEYCFQGCTSLSKVKFPAKLVDIEIFCFEGCKSLQEVTLPNNAYTLKPNCFSNSGLQRIDLGNKVTTIGREAFANTKLETLTIPASVTQCGSIIVNDCFNLYAVYWNPTDDVLHSSTLEDNSEAKSNFLVYVGENAKIGDNTDYNIIRNGVCNVLRLQSTGYYSAANPMNTANRFHCPEAFTAMKVRYIKNYNSDEENAPSKCTRWSTIALPFTPTKVRAADANGAFTRVIAPFDAAVEGAAPFWLREFTTEGYKDATVIEVGKPYIIAMPYNKFYNPNYNINGKVEFSAENVTIPVTPQPATVSTSAYSLTPTYSYIESSKGYLGLNRSAVTLDNVSYAMGAVYNEDYIRPFEAYLTLPAGTTTRIVPLNPTATRSAAQTVKKRVGKVPAKDDIAF